MHQRWDGRLCNARQLRRLLVLPDARGCGTGASADILLVCPILLFASEERSFVMPKRTFQPNRRRRSKTHGFRSRMKTKSGRAVISRRRAKGRKRVSVKPGFRE